MTLEVKEVEDEAEEEAEEVEATAAAVPAAVVNVPQELTAPVVDHAERIARIEERQARRDEELAQQLAALEGRLSEGFNTRMSAYEAAIAKAAEEAEAAPEEVEELGEEEVEVPRVQERPRGIHGRRKARRK